MSRTPRLPICWMLLFISVSDVAVAPNRPVAAAA